MSKTKAWLMDMEDEFYDIADRTVGGCECFDEFATAMAGHKELMLGLYTEEELFEILAEMWTEKWENYA